jgi:hypothetical protein
MPHDAKTRLKQHIQQHGPIKIACTVRADTFASVDGLHLAGTGWQAQFGKMQLSKTGRVVRRLTHTGPFRTTQAEVEADIARSAAIDSDGFQLRAGPVHDSEASRILSALGLK